MVNQSTEKKNTRQIQMAIEGHKVTVSFAQEANPTLSTQHTAGRIYPKKRAVQRGTARIKELCGNASLHCKNAYHVLYYAKGA